MRYLLINGRKEAIPPFPHHKDYIYRCAQYFRPRSAAGLILSGRAIFLRQLWKGWRHDCIVPRDLLIDPTSACNLRCRGCWAADYGRADQLSFDELDRIFDQCEELLLTDILMTGGEPMLRKDDILRLARKHRSLTFGVFTNATLIDAAAADEIAATPNLNMFISIEGNREETDFRRGAGVYDKCLQAMKLLRERDVAFAFSACYHAKNCETVASDAYLDWLREQGAWMGWLFKYAPIGRDADLSLVCTPRQRAWVRGQIADYCARERYTVIDFWNMGHVSTGCVAAGHGFIHINARGDVEPCAFCHYSDSNIRDKSLIESLQSPFFRAFRAAQPFTDNPLRACPMLDAPQSLVQVCAAGGAHSTHYDAPETPEALAEKCRGAAEAWQPVAGQLYRQLDRRWQRTFAGVSRAHRLRLKCFDRPWAEKSKEE